MPVSVMPDVVARMGVPEVPYVMDWSMPTYSLAGELEVTGLQVGDSSDRSP